jgi:hypothetical protein
MTGYDLSRNFWNWAFENPEKIKPVHSALYFFCIEHCNRLGWKDKFGLPSQMAMEAIGVKNWRTYSAGLNDLVEYGFIKFIQKSKNQYSSNIIAIVKNTKAPTKALDKALQKHSTKHSQSTVSIDKQETKNKEQRTSVDWFIPFLNNIADRKFKTYDKNKLIKRLELFTREEIELAITNAINDDFHKSNDFKYLTPDYWLRNDKQIDKWLNSTKGKPESQMTEYEKQQAHVAKQRKLNGWD